MSGGTTMTGTGLIRTAVFMAEISVRSTPLTRSFSQTAASSSARSFPILASSRFGPNFRETSFVSSTLSGLS